MPRAARPKRTKETIKSSISVNYYLGQSFLPSFAHRKQQIHCKKNVLLSEKLSRKNLSFLGKKKKHRAFLLYIHLFEKGYNRQCILRLTLGVKGNDKLFFSSIFS